MSPEGIVQGMGGLERVQAGVWEGSIKLTREGVMWDGLGCWVSHGFRGNQERTWWEMSPNGWLFVIAAPVGTGLWVLSWEVLRGRKEGSLQKNKFQSKCFICNLNYSRGFPILNFSLSNWANVSLWAFCYLDRLSNLSSSRHQQNTPLPIHLEKTGYGNKYFGNSSGCILPDLAQH